MYIHHQGNTIAALEYAHNLQQNIELNTKPELFKFLSDLYREKKDYVQALRCNDSMVVYKDSLIQMQNHDLVEKIRIKMEIFSLHKKMDSELTKINNRKKTYLLLFIGSLLLLFTTIVASRNMLIRHRQSKKLMELELQKRKNEKLLAETQMRETEMVAHYQREIMNQELTATSMFISTHNAIIEEVLQKIQEIRRKNSNSELSELINHLRQRMKETNEHDTFLMNFQSANPGLLDKIRELHPNLTYSDLQFIAYIRMNIAPRDIASLINITPESCKRRRIRLSKKLGLD